MRDIGPRTQRGAMRVNKLLQSKIDDLNATVAMLEEQIQKLTADEVPTHVMLWMKDYNLPWQMFRCYRHDKWFSELDSLFPYHIEHSISRSLLI